MTKLGKLSAATTRVVIGAVVVAIVATGAYFVFFNGPSMNTVTARFPQAVGVYVGTPVRILGVQVGDVTKVTPQAQYVAVEMEYDSSYRIRKSDASAQEVANSLVSDRYINLGTLIDKKDPASSLTSGAIIPQSRTSSPAELDDIYAALNTLSVALGPKGANKGGKNSGALSALLKVSAANLKGNGQAIGNSVTKLAAAARTLSDNRGGLFATVKNLQKFTTALKQSDGQVRLFNTQLAEVTGQLAAERNDLGSALQQLGLALDDVNQFVKGNQAKFHTDIVGLKVITGILARQKAALNESLALAPVALANLTHAYYPQYGSLGTRSNLVSLTAGLPNSELIKTVCGAVNNLVTGTGLGSVVDPVLGKALNPVCPTKTKTKTPGKTGSTASSTPLTTSLNGGIPPGMLVGSGK